MANQHANETEQHALEETPRPSAEGQEPSGDKKEEVFLFTEAEVAERHGKLRQEIASLTKQVATGAATAAQLAEVRQQLATLQEAADARELEALDGSPDLKAIRQRQIATAKEQREERARLEQEKAEHGSAMAKVKQLELLELAQSVAKEFTGVEAADLLDMGFSGEEQMRKAAEKLAKKVAAPVIKADSGIGSGASSSWRDMTPEEKIEHALGKPKK